MSLELLPPSSNSPPQGIFLVRHDGNRDEIMVAGMEPPSSSSGYHVWLMRGQDKVWASQIGIDDRAWGTVSLILPESIKGYEKVELTEADSRYTSAPTTDMVLVGDLVSMNTPGTLRGLNYTPIGQFCH